MRDTIGEHLVRAGLLGAIDLAAALAEQARTGERLGAVLVRLGLATEAQIARALAAQLGFPFVTFAEQPPDPAAAALVPEDIARRHLCVGAAVEANQLSVAMADPVQFGVAAEIEARTGYRVRPAVAPAGEIANAIDSVYREAGSRGSVREEIPAHAEIAPDPGRPPVDAQLSDVIGNAIAAGASEVLLEPAADRVVLRHRIDGVLATAGEWPTASYENLVAQLKRSAGMDEQETRLPQEGRLRWTNGDAFHVSAIRTAHGERIVLRARPAPRMPPALDALGMSPSALERTRALLRGARGLILVVGPARAGKTTAVAAAVAAIDTESTSVVAIDESPEYEWPGVASVAIPTTRAAAFDEALRQRPQVVVVDDLGDAAVAPRAVEAARVETLVLAAIEADDAVAALRRLATMGIDLAALASALACVITVRLVRRLCLACRQAHSPSAEARRLLGLSDADASGTAFYAAAGCAACGHTGYRGRVGVFEVLPISTAERSLIEAGAFDRLNDGLLAAEVATLAEDGLARVMSGTTTADELLRAVGVVGDAHALCPACGSPVSGGYIACPRCGERLGGTCRHCGRSLLPAWRFCPYCAGAAEPAGRRAARRGRGAPGKVTEFRKAVDS